MTTTTQHAADTSTRAGASEVPGWVRVGLLVLAAPQAVTGLWALLDATHWFERFPGFDPRLVAAEPPFNAHLVRDAGSGFVATAVALVLAAWFADRRSVWIGLLTYLAFAVPHFAYHALEWAPDLTDSENVTNVVTLGIGVVLPVALWLATLRPRAAST